MPSTILQVHREFAPRGLSVLAINIREARGTVERWVRKNGIQFPVLLDSDGTVTRAYSVSGTPTVFLVGRTGQLVGKAVGPRGWMSEAGRKLLEALLDQPAG